MGTICPHIKTNKMTTIEMLALVEAKIRKDIPRTMEFREGCLIKEIKTGLIYKILNISDDGYLVTLQRLKGGRIENIAITTFENISEIIGHDIMVNDVLDWLAKYDFYCITSNGNLMKPVDGGKYYYEFEFTEIKVNLSSPCLKDQSEELIKFLYNLIKE